MRHYKKVEQVRTILDHTTCDWCNREILDNDGSDYFDIDLKYHHYYAFHEDSFTYEDSWWVDLCPYCINKVRKFLEESGVKVQEHE